MSQAPELITVRTEGRVGIVTLNRPKQLNALNNQLMDELGAALKAMDLVLTGRMMDATEAERAGLVSRVVPLDKLMDEALGAALTICEYSLPSVMAAKESVNRSFEGGLSDGVMFERRMFHAMFATDDQKEGMDAFVNKRKPVFTHR
jgi:enoyl-CoA hydratase